MTIKDIIISILAIVIAVLLPHLGGLPNFGYTLIIFPMVWLCLKYFGENFSDIGFSFKAFNIKAVVIGSITALLILGFMQLIFFPVLEQLVTFEDTDVELYSFIRKSKWNFAFILIIGWIVGGFYEEIVFHGFIYTRLEKMIPGKYAIVVSFLITSLLFGAYHIQLGPLGAINALIVGVCYHALFLYYKRNLWYSIICHGVYDTVVITLIYLDYL